MMRDYKEKILNINNTIKQANNQIKELQATINHLHKEKQKVKPTKKEELEITDHACLRYMERVYGIEIDDIKDRMLSSMVYDGDTFRIQHDGELKKVILAGNKVTTIY